MWGTSGLLLWLDSKAAGECLITLEKGNYQTLYAHIPALAFGLMGARLKYLLIIVNRKKYIFVGFQIYRGLILQRQSAQTFKFISRTIELNNKLSEQLIIWLTMN